MNGSKLRPSKHPPRENRSPVLDSFIRSLKMKARQNFLQFTRLALLKTFATLQSRSCHCIHCAAWHADRNMLWQEIRDSFIYNKHRPRDKLLWNGVSLFIYCDKCIILISSANIYIASLYYWTIALREIKSLHLLSEITECYKFNIQYSSVDYCSVLAFLCFNILLRRNFLFFFSALFFLLLATIKKFKVLVDMNECQQY